MKKTIKAKKLTLNRTTLRILCESHLKNIIGGVIAPDSECGTCDDTCASCICHTAECPPGEIILA